MSYPLGMIGQVKTCSKCGELKPITEFYKTPGGRDGRRTECRTCNLAARKARYDSASAVERAKRWRLENPERFAAWQAEYRNRPERKRKMRDLYYRRTYGLSADEVDAILVAQDGVCAICGQAPERAASLHLDHDHRTGRLRGILCLNCNQALGKLGPDPAVYSRAAAYLGAR